MCIRDRGLTQAAVTAEMVEEMVSPSAQDTARILPVREPYRLDRF